MTRQEFSQALKEAGGKRGVVSHVLDMAYVGTKSGRAMRLMHMEQAAEMIADEVENEVVQEMTESGVYGAVACHD